MESLQENNATGQVYLYRTVQSYSQKYICTKLWRPMDSLFHTITLPSPPFQPLLSAQHSHPTPLLHNTNKATQHLKIIIWVWLRTLKTYSYMRQKNSTIANYCNDENSLRQSWWKMCRYDLQKKDNFIFWRNLWYHTIELKDIFIHKI